MLVARWFCLLFYITQNTLPRSKQSFVSSTQDENGNVALGTPSGSDTDASSNDLLPTNTSTIPSTHTTTTTTIPLPDPATSAAGPTSSTGGTEQPDLSSSSSSSNNPKMMIPQDSCFPSSPINHNTAPQLQLKHNNSWNSYCSTLSVALLSIPFGVLLWYSSVGAFERLADRYMAALLGLSD